MRHQLTLFTCTLSCILLIFSLSLSADTFDKTAHWQNFRPEQKDPLKQKACEGKAVKCGYYFPQGMAFSSKEALINSVYLPPQTGRTALIDLYQNTDGVNWNYNTNWLSPPEEMSVCDWYGVHCSSVLVGSQDDGQPIWQQIITALYLHSNNLQGPLSATIGELTDLTLMRMGSNGLTGNIPESLWQLTNLTELSLGINQLDGTLPAAINQLTHIVTLSLGDNDFSGSLPATIGDLLTLETLGLANNAFSGNIPDSIGNLSQLIYLFASKNQLTGSLPATLGNLTQLTYLGVQNNLLTGTLPVTVGGMTNLVTLAAGYNQLTGPLPPTLGDLSALEGLHLSNNQINGELPATLGNLQALTALSLWNNQLTGNIPSTFANLTNLTDLLLSYNALSGLLPPSYYSLLDNNVEYVNRFKLGANPGLGGPMPQGFDTLYPQLFETLKVNNMSNMNSGLGDLACVTNNDAMAQKLTGTNWNWYRCSDEANSCPEKNTGPDCMAGNPVNTRTGVKVQSNTDYQAPGSSSLNITRTYSSAHRRWQFNISHQKLYINGQSITVKRSNGRSYIFTCNTTCAPATTRLNPIVTQQYQLEKIATGFVFYQPNGASETYDSSGLLVKTTNASGFSQTFSRNDATMVITDQFGNALTITFDDAQRPESLQTPEGAFYYGYDEQGQLASVTHPDNSLVQYVYDEPELSEAGPLQGLLTGIIDENGDRHGSWHYDLQHRAFKSYHGLDADNTEINFASETQFHKTLAGGYITSNQPIRNVTGPLGARTRYHFDQSDGLRAQQIDYFDLAGNLSASEYFAYNANRFLAQKTDKKGTITQYSRDSRGRELSRTEAVNTSLVRVIQTEYLNDTSLPTLITTDETLVSYQYNARQQVTSMTIVDRATNNTRTTTNTYNAEGLLLSIDGPRTDVSDITTFEYDAQGRKTKTTNALGHVSEILSYDSSGRPTAIKTANGITTTLTYNLRGWLTSSTTNNQTTVIDYDAVGQQTLISLPTGQTIAYEYDAAHRLTATEDNLGNRIEYTLDGAGNKIKTDIRDPNGTLKHTRRQLFDAFSRLKSVVSGEGNASGIGYNGADEVTSQTDPLNHQTDNTFDALGRLVTTLDPAGGATEFGFDNAGQNTSVTDAENKTTSYIYNGFGEVTEQNSPDTGITRYTYDKAGNMVQKVQVGIDRTTNYQFDALNRLISDSALAATYTYDQTPNGIGRLTTITDNSGSQQFTYDAFGNIISDIRTIDNTVLTTQYHYNEANQHIGMTYPSGRRVDYLLNTLGQISQISTTKDSKTQILALNIQYLPYGPMAGFNYGNGLPLAFDYDLDYRRTIQSTGTIENKYIVYTPRDNIQSITDTSNSQEDQNFTYSALQRLISATGDHGNLDYSYDGIGNRLSKSDDGQTDSYSYVIDKHHLQSISGTQNTSFTYNQAGETLSKGPLSFSYNDAGRLSSVTNTGITTNYQYNHLGQRVTKTSGQITTRFVYHQSGKLIAQVSQSGTSDVEYIYLGDQLLSVIHNPVVVVPPAEDLAFDDVDTTVSTSGNWSRSKSRKAFNGYHQTASGGSNSTLTWTPQIIGGTYQVYVRWVSNRKYSNQAVYAINHNDTTSSVTANQTSNGNQWNLLGTFDFNGQGGESIALDDANGKVSADGIRLVRTADLPPQNSETQIYYVHNNHINTPTKLTDSTGQIVWSALYTPFGLATINDDVDGNNSHITFNPRFPGQYFDSETGLHYNWHRYYLPETGRYLTSDPLGLYDGPNTYGYVQQNPINLTDPNGQSSLVLNGGRMMFVPLPFARVVGGVMIGIGGIIVLTEYFDDYDLGDPNYGGYTQEDENDAVDASNGNPAEMSCAQIREYITVLENRIRGRQINNKENGGGDKGHRDRVGFLEDAKTRLEAGLFFCEEDKCE